MNDKKNESSQKEKYDCDIPGKKVITIDDCMDCYRMCVYNPKSWASREWSSGFVNRWGVKEIVQCLSDRRRRA